MARRSGRGGGGAPAPKGRAMLTPAEIDRYGRHLTLPEVGLAGQLALRAAKVLVVGAGGLGSPSALYLAAAGVGEIGLVDFDRVERSNLQRQILYTTQEIGSSKLVAARRRLRALNPGTRVRAHRVELAASNVLATLEGYDVVLDGTDNFPARYLVNDACVRLGIPEVFGSVYRFEGQVSVFDGRRGPCYRCLFPEPPPPEAVPSCAEGGVLGVLPGIVGLLMATEAIKLLIGRGEALVGRLLLLDALTMRFRELSIAKDPDCPRCSPGRQGAPIVDLSASCADESIPVPTVPPIALQRELLGPSPPTLIDVREPGEYALSHLPRAKLIPEGELLGRRAELPDDAALVLYCRSGGRSERAARRLLELGFPKVRSLRGGLAAWARSVDPSMAVA